MRTTHWNWITLGRIAALGVLLSHASEILADAPLFSEWDTNKDDLYLTLSLNNRDHSIIGKDGVRRVRTQQLLDARKSPESRPAALDPEGHWGEVLGGFQISLRLARPSYTNAEPIVATVLIRNVSDHDSAWPWIFRSLPECVELEITDPAGKKMTGAEREYSPFPKSVQLWYRTQWRVEIPLRDRFEFEKPGNHVLRAKMKIHDPNEPTKLVDVASGLATFELMAAGSKAAQTNAIPREK